MSNQIQEHEAITSLATHIMNAAMESLMTPGGVAWKDALFALGLVARGIAELSQKLTDDPLPIEVLQEETITLLMRGMTQVEVQLTAVPDDGTHKHFDVVCVTQETAGKMH